MSTRKETTSVTPFGLKAEIYHGIRDTLAQARAKAYAAINFAMVEAYWDVGRQIDGAIGERAEYGKGLLQYVSERLTAEFGKGYTARNLRAMRQFYATFPIRHTLCAELSWSHYRLLMKVEENDRRVFYLKECVESNWSVRQLERQINSFYYERLLTPQDVGQMDFYVRLFEDKFRQPDDNATIGIILCSARDENVVRYSVLADKENLFASKYKLYLPTEEELKKELECERALIEQRQDMH